MTNRNNFGFCTVVLLMAVVGMGCQAIKQEYGSMKTNLSQNFEKGKKLDTDGLIKVTIDGNSEDSQQWEKYWVLDGHVSSKPKASFTMDSSMGDFESCVLYIFRAGSNDRETGSPVAITDFDSEKQVMVPGKRFVLNNPGKDVSILRNGEEIDEYVLESGQKYIVQFYVTGSYLTLTHRVQFTVR